MTTKNSKQMGVTAFAILFAASSFAANVMEGAVKERIYSDKGTDVLVGFARCGALLTDAAVEMQMSINNGSRKFDDVDVKIVSNQAQVFIQSLLSNTGSTTDEKKRQKYDAITQIADLYRELKRTDVGMNKTLADLKDCQEYLRGPMEVAK
jgi:hypothetical protein